MDFNKIVKWGKSALRVCKYKVKYRNQLKFDYSKNKKPVYFGKGVDISIDKDCSLQMGGVRICLIIVELLLWITLILL